MKKRIILRLCSFAFISCLISSLFLTIPNWQAYAAELGLQKNNASTELFNNLNETLGIIDPADNVIPDDYAGAYIDENNELKICVTIGQSEKYMKQINPAVIASAVDEIETPITSLQKRSITEDIVEIVEQPFSYQFLNAIQDALDLKMMEFPISQTSIYQDKNCVEIELTDMSAKDQVTTYLQRTVPDFSADAISYKQAAPLSAKTDYAYAGTKTYWELFAASYGSVGFNASYKDSGGKVHYGVVTNAHVAPLNKSMKLSALKTIGKTILSKYSSTVDVAFVEFNSGWARTDRVLNGNGEQIYRVAPASEMIQGGYTNKYGATTGKQAGQITATSTTATVAYSDGTRSFTDVFKFSNKTDGGDSGGVVGRQRTKEVFRLLGLTFAGPTNSTDYGLGIKYSNISKLGITAYTTETK